MKGKAHLLCYPLSAYGLRQGKHSVAFCYELNRRCIVACCNFLSKISNLFVGLFVFYFCKYSRHKKVYTPVKILFLFPPPPKRLQFVFQTEFSLNLYRTYVILKAETILK